MIQEVAGFVVMGLVGLVLVAGCFRLIETVSVDSQEEELESWHQQDHDWIQQLLEQRRREFEAQVRSKEV